LANDSSASPQTYPQKIGISSVYVAARVLQMKKASMTLAFLLNGLLARLVLSG
jgi:hypothetical protein